MANFSQNKIYSFQFTTKVMGQKTYTDTIWIKLFFMFAIFSKLVKSEPFLAILLFYDANLTVIVAKLPTFKKKTFFLQKLFSWKLYICYNFHFTTKIIKQKLSADTILIKFFIFLILQYFQNWYCTVACTKFLKFFSRLAGFFQGGRGAETWFSQKSYAYIGQKLISRGTLLVSAPVQTKASLDSFV